MTNLVHIDWEAWAEHSAQTRQLLGTQAFRSDNDPSVEDDSEMLPGMAEWLQEQQLPSS